MIDLELDGLPAVDPAELAARHARALLAGTIQLRLQADRIIELNDLLDEHAVILRNLGASWGTIGEALRITRQAAQQRYARFAK